MPQILSTSGSRLLVYQNPSFFGQGFDAIYIGKLNNRRFTYVSLHEGDVEGHHGVDGIRCELRRSDVEVV